MSAPRTDRTICLSIPLSEIDKKDTWLKALADVAGELGLLDERVRSHPPSVSLLFRRLADASARDRAAVVAALRPLLLAEEE